MTVVGVWNKIGTLASVQYCGNDVSFSYGWSWCGVRFYQDNTLEGQCRKLQLLFVRGGTSTIGGNFSRYLSILVGCRVGTKIRALAGTSAQILSAFNQVSSIHVISYYRPAAAAAERHV